MKFGNIISKNQNNVDSRTHFIIRSEKVFSEFIEWIQVRNFLKFIALLSIVVQKNWYKKKSKNDTGHFEKQHLC